MRQRAGGPEGTDGTGSSPRSAAESSGGASQQSLAGRNPVLDVAQLEVLRRYGSEHDMAAGEVLFADGDVTYDLIAVLAGEARIIERRGQPDERVINTYRRSQFLGEIGLLTGQRAYLSAVAGTAGRVLRVPVQQVRVIMAQELGLSELILRTFLLRHSILTRLGSGLTLIGSRFDAGTRRLLEVLARNRLASTWLELEGSPEAETMLRALDVPVGDLPIVVVPGGPLLRNPGSRELLGALGMSGPGDTDLSGVCDLLVGAGPAGLAAAVYGASDGMATVLAEDTALGGQAGTSSRIENYLGFPAGLSGEELAARATLQAQKFGVRIKLASKAVSLSSEACVHRVSFDDGDAITAKSVITATGARYNRLPLGRLAEFEGVGVYYAATQMEAQACRGGPVAIVGGGNSAGQAALFLSRSSAEVHVIIRGETLGTSMSRYLTGQIERNPPHYRHAPNARHRAARERSAGRRGAAGYRPAAEVGTGGPGPVRFHRRTAGHRLAGGPARRGHSRVPAHRQQHPASSARRRRPDAAVPGDQPAGSLRRRRRAQRVHQAHRDRNRGRLDGGAAGVRTPPGYRQRGRGPAPRRGRRPQCPVCSGEVTVHLRRRSNSVPVGEARGSVALVHAVVRWPSRLPLSQAVRGAVRLFGWRHHEPNYRIGDHVGGSAGSSPGPAAVLMPPCRCADRPAWPGDGRVHALVVSHRLGADVAARGRSATRRMQPARN